MKLWNVTSAVALGALFVFGCSVETTPGTTDGGTTDGATDSAKVDTGTATDTGPGATDTGTPPTTEGGVDAGDACKMCQEITCKPEQDACRADMMKLQGCNDLIKCMNACTDTACQNACISSSMSSEGKALLSCVQMKCASACGG